jgi:hypothetical protein
VTERNGWLSWSPVPGGGVAPLMSMLDNLIGVHDDRDEEGEHHVDEEGAEEVEIRLAVHPHRPRLNKTEVNKGEIVTDVQDDGRHSKGPHGENINSRNQKEAAAIAFIVKS